MFEVNRKKFSRSAAYYARHAGLQRRLAAATAELVPKDRAPSRILDIGCGTGFLTREMSERFPTADIIGLDLSEGMVLEARSYLSGRPRVEILLGDALGVLPHAELVVSSSTFQWLRPLDQGIRGIFQCLSEDGLLCFSLMTEGTLEALERARSQISPQGGFGFPRIAEIRELLGEVGFELEAEREETFSIRFASAEEFLKNLSNLGVSGRLEKPLGRASLRRLLELLGGDSEFESVYKVGFFLVRKSVIS